MPSGLTEFTDEAGRKAYKDASGMVFTEGGSNPTNYNVSQWNTRQRERWGKGGEGGSAGSSSSFDLNKMYKSAMEGEDIKGLESELESKKAALNKARSKINDNPFYSEATRVGRIAKLEEAAQRDIANVESTLARKRADVEVELGLATQQYQFTQQELQNNINRLNTLIDTGAISRLSPQDLASLATSTGMTTGMLQSLQQSKAGTSDSTLIQAYDSKTGEMVLVNYDVRNNRLIGTTPLPGITSQDGVGGGGSSIETYFDEVPAGTAYGTYGTESSLANYPQGFIGPQIPEVPMEYFD